MDETDLFFNLRLGELVLSTGQVPTENLLSFTFPAVRDINLAWLFQIVLALVHRVGGIPGTVLLKTGFVLGTWAILYRVAVRRGAHPWLAALALALAAWSAEPRFVERPHLVTFLGLALLLLALERAETGRPRMLWGLVPAGLLWANGNSCFFLAPTILLLYAAGAWLDGAKAHARRAALVAVAMLPLIFATPSGVHALTYLANHIRMPWLRPLQEYRSARWPLDGPFFFLVVGLAASAAAALLLRQRQRLLPWRVLLPLMVLAVLGGLRIRFVAEFSMLAGPALAVAASPWLPRKPVLTAAAALGLVSLTLVPRALAGPPWLDLGMEADLFPEAAISFVEQRGLRGRMYNDLEVGSYLTWRWWPDHRVFQDPRINGFPESFHALLRRTDLTANEWQGFLDSFAVDAALLTYPGVNPRGAWFDPKLWALVYRASDGLVFTRRLPDRAALIAEVEIPLTFSYAESTGLEARPLPQPAESAIAACEWQRRLGDWQRSDDLRAAARSFEEALDNAAGPCLQDGWQAKVRESLAAMTLQLGDARKAARLLEGLTSSEARTNHGFALLAQGQSDQALVDFDAALAGRPGNDEALFGRGLALEALGRRGEAAAAFQDLLARSPRHLSASAAREHLGRLSPNPSRRNGSGQ
jgi:tetratricopeptide (TPR) repeat protein